MSLRLRLTLWHSLALALVLATAAALGYLAVERQLSAELEHDLQVRALQASRELRAVSLSAAGGSVRAVDLATAAGVAGDRLLVQVVGPDGQVRSRSRNLREPMAVPPESLRLALGGQEVHDSIDFRGQRIELYSAPLTSDGQIVGVLQVGAPRQPLDVGLAQLRWILAATGLAVLGLAALLAWWLATRALRPVDRMTRTARNIGRSSDLSQRLPAPDRADELGRLAQTFNEMLERLDTAFSTQRRFLADASHELRTPLTAIRTNAESLLRNGQGDPETRESLAAIARESARMGRMVDDLLALARADAGQPLAHDPVALDTLVLEVFQQERALAGEVKLEIGELTQVEVTGDRDRLKQLLLNLVDNGLRYTPPGGLVQVGVFRDREDGVLEVQDTGPGIPAEHLPHIFERFYRVDGQRSRAVGGTGLGLAICRWVAEAHRGTIEVESRIGEGTVFRVKLPMRPDAVVPRLEPLEAGGNGSLTWSANPM
jgi:two-component system, OmpR family, sensor kinase